MNKDPMPWVMKAFFRVVCINLSIVGIGTLAWSCFSPAAHGGIVPVPNDYVNYFNDLFDGTSAAWPGLITFSVSAAWCLLCLAIQASRKRPVHPGVVVGLELCLWLAYGGTLFCVIVGLLSLQNYGTGWEIGGSASVYLGNGDSGDYNFAPNGTLVWHSTGTTDGYTRNYTRQCDLPNTDIWAGNHLFTSCAEVDAFTNKLWQIRPHRIVVITVAVVCQFLNAFIHLFLFIWACVDTNRYNRRTIKKDAEKRATQIVQAMITNGAIVPTPGQTYMRPCPGQGSYYQLPNQQIPNHQLPNQHAYPMMPMNNAQQMPGQVPVDHSGYYHPGPSVPPRPSSVPRLVTMVPKTSTRYT